MAPTNVYMIWVVEPVIEVLVIVNASVAPAAIEIPVKVQAPDLPLHVTEPDAAPDPVAGDKTIPLPAALDTKFPFVAVMFPKVAVTVVVAVNDPGAVNVDGIDSVTIPEDDEAVISLAVPNTETTLPEEDVTKGKEDDPE